MVEPLVAWTVTGGAACSTPSAHRRVVERWTQLEVRVNVTVKVMRGGRAIKTIPRPLHHLEDGGPAVTYKGKLHALVGDAIYLDDPPPLGPAPQLALPIEAPAVEAPVQSAALDLRVAATRFLVLDTETTGVGHDARIVEISALGFGPKEEPSVLLDTVVDPEIPVPVEASRVHGLRDADVRGAPTFAEILPTLLAALDGRVLVAHNAVFDVGVLGRELARAGHALRPPALCTMLLGGLLPGGKPNLSLAMARATFGGAEDADLAAHGARGDAMTCARVLRRERMLALGKWGPDATWGAVAPEGPLRALLDRPVPTFGSAKPGKLRTRPRETLASEKAVHACVSLVVSAVDFERDRVDYDGWASIRGPISELAEKHELVRGRVVEAAQRKVRALSATTGTESVQRSGLADHVAEVMSRWAAEGSFG
jgi:DNA polymerase III epsilon subunit-like protein